MIYDLHTLLHKKHTLTQTNNQLTRRQQEWMHSISPSGSWPAGRRVSCGQIEDKGTFITGKAIAGTSERTREWKNKKERQRTKIMFAIVFQLRWKCHYCPPCVYVQLYASHTKALWLCLTIGEQLKCEDRWANGDDQLDATVREQKENKKIWALSASCWMWSFQDEVEAFSLHTLPFSTQDKVKERLLINI